MLHLQIVDKSIYILADYYFIYRNASIEPFIRYGLSLVRRNSKRISPTFKDTSRTLSTSANNSNYETTRIVRMTEPPAVPSYQFARHRDQGHLRRRENPRRGIRGCKRRTYKSLLDGVSKHCSQKSALLAGRTRSAEVDMVLGRPPVAPMPAPNEGELMPPPHLLRPLAKSN